MTTAPAPAPASLAAGATGGDAAGPPARTLHCRTVAAGGFKQLNYVRDLPPIAVQERLDRPGGEEDLSPVEAMLAALGSCLTARIRANAIASGTAIHTLALDVEGDLAVSGMWGQPGATPPRIGFGAIRVRVTIDADLPADRLRAMINHALMWSPVANTLHDAVDLNVSLAGPPPAHPLPGQALERDER